MALLSLKLGVILLKRVVTGNSEMMRKINSELVINQIITSGVISRSELSKQLGLALPTVMRIVEGLLQEGFVVEVGFGNSSGGRKPTMLKINEKYCYYIGVCIQRKLKIVLADTVGTILSRYEKVFDYQRLGNDDLDQIITGINSVISTAHIEIADNCYIGIGTPGSNFKHTALVEQYPFYKWANFDVNTWLYSGLLPYPTVCENIPKLGALAELRFGMGLDVKDFIYIYADYGIGMGIVINGELYMGAGNVAGEFGHMIIEQNGLPCYCGNRGCIEMYSSSFVILEQLRRMMRKKGLAVNNISDPDKLQFSDALISLEQGDPQTTLVFAEAGSILGKGLASLINLFNPELIILGGELSNCTCYVQAAKKAALSSIFMNAARNTRIEISRLGHEDLLKGAVALAMNWHLDHYFKQ